MGENTGPLTLPTVISAALVDSLNPCSFALLLVFVASVVSMVERRSGHGSDVVAQRWLLSRGGVYVFGIFITYLALGFGLLGMVGLAGSLTSTHIVTRVAAILAIGLGLLALQEALLPELGIRLSARVDMGRMKGLVGRLSMPALFAAGALVGLCTVPCSGSVYLAVVALLSARATLLEGSSYLVLYNIVFILPLVILLAAASNRAVYRRLARWQLHHRPYLKLGTSIMALSVGLMTLMVV